MNNPGTRIDNLLLNKLYQDYFKRGTVEEVYLPVSEGDFNKLIPILPNTDVVLISLFCVENFQGVPGFTLFYAFEKRDSSNIVLIQRHLPSSDSVSIAEYFPSACWFEREIKDGFGIQFHNAFDKRRLFLHGAYPFSFHPLLKSFKNGDLTEVRKTIVSRGNYLFREIKGNGVYQVLVGPVHAGIIEPGHFHFNVIGETILSLEVRMFYKHRGLEKLAEGKCPADGVAIAETISGDETAANASAFCSALERIAGCQVPERAWQLRTIILELERIDSHLGDLAGMLVDVAYPLGAAEFHILREEIFRQNAALTGSRFLKGIVCPGGLKRDIPQDILTKLNEYLNCFIHRFQKATRFAHRSSSVIDRLETTGVIKPALINPLNITGPAARASGIEIDNRVDHPYGIYAGLRMHKRTAENGDVLARFDVKILEILDSVTVIQKLIAGIQPGDVWTQIHIRDGYALSIVESARGQNIHWVYVKDGVIDRYKVRTASFCNWQAIEHAVIGNIVPDFPLINKSLNLSYAGTDL